MRGSAVAFAAVLGGAFAVALAAAPASQAAATLHVTSGDDAGPGSLRAAVTNAESGDAIVIDRDVPSIGLASQIVIDKSLTIDGQGAADTVIDAQDGSRIFDIGQAEPDITVTISDLTLTGGKAPHEADGGAIRTAGTVHLDAVALTGNAAGDGGDHLLGHGGVGADGGAIMNTGTLTITDSTLSHNTAGTPGTASKAKGGHGGSGGAIENTGTLTITDSTLTANTATAGADGYDWPGQGEYRVGTAAGDGGSGGAIDNHGTLTITGSVLADNTAGAGGHGGQGEARLNSTGSPGGAGADGGDGGAINNVYGATASITDSVLSGNAAGAGGAGGFGGTGTNAEGGKGGPAGAGGAGGAIANAGTLTVARSTLSHNAAGAGGAGGQGGESAKIKTCKHFAGGPGVRGGAGGDGGGIANTELGTFVLRNSTLVGNAAGDGGAGGAGGTGSRAYFCRARGGDGGDAGNGGTGGSGGGVSNNSVKLQVVGTEISSTIAGNSSGSAGAGGTGGDGGEVSGNPSGDDGAPGDPGTGGAGGGISVVSSQPGTAFVNQAIGLLLANNAAAAGANCSGVVEVGDRVNLTYLSGGGTGGCDSFPISADPQLQDQLTGNGGPTRTLAPAEGSPAVDAISGDSTITAGGRTVVVCPSRLDGSVTDQRGVLRPQGDGCDIGAVELAVGIPQSIAFTSSPPSPATIGTSYTPAATATSGLPVTFSIDPASDPGVCAIDANGVVSFTAQGTCIIDADQPGNPDYAPAVRQQQRIAVTPPAITRYVDRDGGIDANNDCTDQAKPCATVGHAVDESQDNGTILIAPGTYTHHAAELTVDNDLTIRRWDDGGTDPVVIQGTGWILDNDIDGMHVSSGATVIIEDLTITSERAAGLVSSGTTTVIGSTITGHEGIGASGDLTVINSTVLAQGGLDSLHVYGGTVTVIGSTFDGGRVASHGTTTVAGSIVTSCWRPVVDAGYNVEPGTSCGFTDPTSQPNTDPQLPGQLTDNGGPTKTLVPDPASPAVDAIPAGTSVTIDGADTVLCPGEPDGSLTDQRGVPRPQQGGCDSGAVEVVTGLRQQAIAFISTPPEQPATGETYTPAATAGSGLPVSFSIDPVSGGACSIDSGVVSFDAPGTCVIDADQAGNARYAPAPRVQQAIPVHEALRVVTSTLPSGTVGAHYSAQLRATGGLDSDYTWRLVQGDALPPGLGLSASGLISGKPSRAGQYTFTVTVNDPVPAEFTLTIDPSDTTTTSTGQTSPTSTGETSPTSTAQTSGTGTGGTNPTGTGGTGSTSTGPTSTGQANTGQTSPTNTGSGGAPSTEQSNPTGAGQGGTTSATTRPPATGTTGTAASGSASSTGAAGVSGSAGGSGTASSGLVGGSATIGAAGETAAGSEHGPGGTPNAGSDQLATTGIAAWPELLAGMLLALAGLVLLAITRRRTVARH